MDTRISDYLENDARFTATVERVSDWSADSPCEGWSAADVVDHVVTTQRDFLAQRGADLGQAPAGGPGHRWSEHRRVVAGLLGDEEWALQPYDGYFGPTTVADTLRDFYGVDLIVHRWDLARADGGHALWDGAEMDRLDTAIAGFGDHLYAEGICRPALEAPADADRQTRILATLGRRA